MVSTIEKFHCISMPTCCMCRDAYSLYCYFYRPNLYIEMNERLGSCEQNIKPLLVTSKDPITGKSVI